MERQKISNEITEEDGSHHKGEKTEMARGRSANGRRQSSKTS